MPENKENIAIFHTQITVMTTQIVSSSSEIQSWLYYGIHITKVVSAHQRSGMLKLDRAVIKLSIAKTKQEQLRDMENQQRRRGRQYLNDIKWLLWLVSNCFYNFIGSHWTGYLIFFGFFLSTSSFSFFLIFLLHHWRCWWIQHQRIMLMWFVLTTSPFIFKDNKLISLHYYDMHHVCEYALERRD